MPFDGNGNYTLPSVYKATAGTTIVTQQHNGPLEDIAAALNAVILRNGSSPVTGNWNMATNRIIFLANGVEDTDAANIGQLKALLNNTALTGTTTVQPVTDWTKYQVVGAKDADSRYVQLASGDKQSVSTPLNIQGSFNIDAPEKVSAVAGYTTAGSMRWQAGRGAGGEVGSNAGSDYIIARFSDAGELIDIVLSIKRDTGIISALLGMNVPDITIFTGEDALNARTAEGRYPASVPTQGQARIASLVQDANGRTLSNGAVLANLADVATSGTSANGFWFKIGTKLIQTFFVENAYEGKVVAFPLAYNPDAEVPPQMIGSMGVPASGSSVWVQLRGPISAHPNSDVTYANVTLAVSYQSGSNGGTVGANTGVNAYITVIGDVG